MITDPFLGMTFAAAEDGGFAPNLWGSTALKFPLAVPRVETSFVSALVLRCIRHRPRCSSGSTGRQGRSEKGAPATKTHAVGAARTDGGKGRAFFLNSAS